MIEYFGYTLWFLITLGLTYFAVVVVNVAFDQKYADKQSTLVAVMVTSVTFFSWYMLYNSITQG